MASKPGHGIDARVLTLIKLNYIDMVLRIYSLTMVVHYKSMNDLEELTRGLSWQN